MNWFITNSKAGNGKSYYTNIDCQIINDEEPFVFIDGYIIPRLSEKEYFPNLSSQEFVNELFRKYQLNFIEHIKGIFTIILFFNDKYYIYNDHQGLMKYFIYQKDETYYITNSLINISEKFILNIDYENVAVFTLTSHFIDGGTLFKEVTVCKPAQLIENSEFKINITFYWTPHKLFVNNGIQYHNIAYYAQKWHSIIKGYIDYLKPKKISITLTGGNDSRMVLAALLAQNEKFHSFTFGNPNSYDGVIAKKIVGAKALDHHFYFVEDPTASWFEKSALNIIGYGNSLINIHRAHRNDAIQQELETDPSIQMIITGFVGGEYIKEPKFDNIVIPRIFEEIIDQPDYEKTLHHIEKTLISKGLNTKLVSIPNVYNKLKNFIDYGKGLSLKERKFIYTYMFYGYSHHAQDTNVFGNYIKYIVNPYMDIDFIELLSGYEKWYVNQKRTIYNSLFSSEFIVSITDYLAPELSNIHYAKKGKYTANDLLRSRLLYVIKRIYYRINNRKEDYPQNFPMGSWLYEFSQKKLKDDSNEILQIFNIPYLKTELEKIKSKTTEGSWQIITNPINLLMINEYYKKN